jgi:tetratricopeptide (TPR) repeat protein
MAIDKNMIQKEAQKFVAKGQYDKAIAEWKKLLKETPNDPNLYNTIGDLSLKKNSKAEAVDAYKRAADILAADGFTSKAIALYKKTLNIDPQKIEVHLALGDLNAEKGLTGNALESYKVVADHYSKAKDTVKALGIYQKMADLNPSNVAFRIKLGDMYVKEGKVAEAVKAYLSAADVHMSKEALKEARQLFEKILAIDPNNKEVYFKAGLVYVKEGKFGEACKALKPAFESDPANRELADAYVDALTRAGKEGDAEQVIKKILAADAGRADLNEKLYQIHLAKKDFEKALTIASALADASIEAGDNDGAEEVLKKFVAAGPDYFPGRQKLAEFFLALGRGEDAATTFLQAAQILADEGDRDTAKAALKRALEIAPGLDEARDLLEQLSEPAPAPPPPPKPQPKAPAAAAAPPPPPKPEPKKPAAVSPPAAPKPAFEERTTAEFDASDFEPPAPSAEPVLEMEAVAAAEEAEDPAIAEAFTEADVLVKYGLTLKALEQLEGLARRFPESVSVRIKLRDVYGDLGQMNKASAHMLVLADLYTSRGREDQARQVLQSALGMDPNNAEIRSRLGIAPTEAAPAKPARVPAKEPLTEAREWTPPAMNEVVPPETQPAGFEPEIESGPSFFEENHPAQEKAGRFEEPAPTDEIVFDGLDAGMPSLEGETPFAEEAQDAVEELPTPPDEEEPVVPGIAAEEPFAERTRPSAGAPPREEYPEEYGEEPVLPAEEVPEPEEPARAQAAAADIGEIWAEAEFYYQQGLFEEAKKHYARIVELNPGEKRAIERLSEISREEEDTKEFSKLAEAVEGLEEAVSKPAEDELPLSVSDEEAVRSLMSEIAQLKKPPPPEPRKTQPPAAPPRTVVPPSKPAPVRAEQEDAGDEDFFDLGAELAADSRSDQSSKQEKPSDDFFDLASELRDELSGVPVPARPAAQAEEQSLDEIFEEFKRGVEQQSTKEDADTHYNLGVAYKEMGLLDDAIGEFILTPEDEPKFIQSRYMLGLCYMEKGEYQNAIGEIQNALDYSETMGDETQKTQNAIGMHYDLGLACQGAGNISTALREFQKVFQLNPRYRDIAVKLKELKQGDFISLDQLKDDIEKEISTKFFEEGERIEREEKIRKNVKIRN